MPLKNSEDFDFEDFAGFDKLTEIKMSAYIKPVVVDNEPVWSVYTADGSVFATVSNKATAEALISQNDFDLVALN